MPIDLYLKNIRIKNVEEFKFLAMHIDQSLIWSKHIKVIKYDCRRKLKLMKYHSNLGWRSDRKTLLRLYLAFKNQN